MATNTTVKSVETTESEFLTTDEYAAKVRATVQTVRYWRKTGYGPQGFRRGRRVLYRTAEINAWLEQLAAEQAGKGGGDRVA